MNYQHKLSNDTIMPPGHIALWKFLHDVLPNEVVCAGSLASVQMKYNMFGASYDYNDIDFWYDEDDEANFKKSDLKSIIGEFKNNNQTGPSEI